MNAKYVGVLAGLILGILVSVGAGAEPVAYNTRITDSKAHVIVSNPGNVQSFSCQIGNKQVKKASISQEISIETILLVDNSYSISEIYHGTISQILQKIIESRSERESITLATFDQEIHYLAQKSKDNEYLLSILGGLTYQDLDTKVTDVMYKLCQDLKKDPFNGLRRILLISDGAEYSSVGYTRQEELTELTQLGYPVYTVGCTFGDNQKELEDLFSLSRLTKASSFWLDQIADPQLIVDDFNRCKDSLSVSIKIPKSLRDGSEKGIKIVLATQEESFTVTTKATMPFYSDGKNQTKETSLEPDSVVIVLAEEEPVTAEEETYEESAFTSDKNLQSQQEEVPKEDTLAKEESSGKEITGEESQQEETKEEEGTKEKNTASSKTEITSSGKEEDEAFQEDFLEEDQAFQEDFPEEDQALQEAFPEEEEKQNLFSSQGLESFEEEELYPERRNTLEEEDTREKEDTSAWNQDEAGQFTAKDQDDPGRLQEEDVPEEASEETPAPEESSHGEVSAEETSEASPGKDFKNKVLLIIVILLLVFLLLRRRALKKGNGAGKKTGGAKKKKGRKKAFGLSRKGKGLENSDLEETQLEETDMEETQFSSNTPSYGGDDEETCFDLEEETEFQPYEGEEHTMMMSENDFYGDALSQKGPLCIRLTDMRNPVHVEQADLVNVITIGRSRKYCDIALENETTVSSQHLEVSRRGEKVYIRDLDSTNGTWLDDQPLEQEREIYSGAVIRLGQMEGIFEIIAPQERGH